MKSKLLLSAGLVGLLTTTTVGCSGGSSQRIGGGGRACSFRQANDFVLPEKASKLSLRPEDSDIPAGVYTYQKADLLYIYKPDPSDTTTWVMVQAVEEAKGLNGEPSVGAYCVRGMRASAPDFGFSATGVNQITVQKDGSMEFSVKDYSFTWVQEEQRIKVSTSPLENSFQSPSEVYDGKANQFNFYKVDGKAKGDRRYEILSVEEYPKKNLTVYLRISLIKSDLKKPVPTSVDEPLTTEVPVDVTEAEEDAAAAEAI